MNLNRSSILRRLGLPRVAILLVALAAALAVLLPGDGGVVHAQTATSLIEVEGGGTQIGFEGERALGFETASSAGTGNGGWVVTGVELRIKADDGLGMSGTATPPALAICDADSDGDPEDTCYVLIPPPTVQIPSGSTSAVVTYTAPGTGHFLSTSSDYTLHFTENGSTHSNDVHHLDASGDDGEATSTAGTFEAFMRELTSSNTWRRSTSNVAWARINGYASPEDPASLIEVEGGGTQIGFEGERALGFTTAASAGTGYDGWVVSEVELRIRPDNGMNNAGVATAPAVSICESDSDGDPDGTCFELTPPPSTLIGTGPDSMEVSYTAPGSGHFLETGKNYTLHFTENDSTHANDVHHLEASSNDGEEVDVAGTFRNSMRELRSGSWHNSTTNVAWVRITGNSTVKTTETDVIVSSIGQPRSDNMTLSSLDLAQSFTTGTNDRGYLMTSIDIRINTPVSVTSAPDVTLHTGSGSGTKVADFTGPASLTENTTATYTFTPTTAFTLAASTEYWLVIQSPLSSRIEISASDSEDFPPMDGASIGDAVHSRHAASTGAFSVDSGSGVVLFSVKGERIAARPALISNLGQTRTRSDSLMSSDFAQGFRAGTEAAGYRLYNIDLLLDVPSGASYPTVTLHRTSSAGPKVADLAIQSSGTGVGAYRYVPTEDVTLATSTWYWVVATAGNASEWYATTDATYDTGAAAGWSIATKGQSRTAGQTGAFTTLTGSGANRFQMGINGVPVPPAGPANNTATGTPTITVPNVYRVPALLTADVSSIADSDGILEIAQSEAYTWQRFAADGTTMEAAGIGTGPTYRLTDADVGKTIKLSFRFRDDADNAEGPFTSAATSVITAAAAVCEAPKLKGGATLAWTGHVPIRAHTGSFGFIASESDSLDNPTFTVGTNTYTVDAVIARTDGGLILSFDKELTTDDRAGFVFHACSAPRQLFWAEYAASGFNYTWSSTGVDWSDHALRTVHLTEDSAKPTFESAKVNGTSLVITFNEELGMAESLANSLFAGKKTPEGGSEAALTFSSTTPAISGKTVTLTLASASSVSATDTDVKISYTKPTTDVLNPIVDAFGNEADSFSDKPVLNELADQVAPELAATDAAVLSTDGATITLTYNEDLNTSSVPAASAFTVEATPAGGSEAEVDLADTTPVAVSGATVVLTLKTSIAHNDNGVKVSYAKPTTGSVIEDPNENAAASFTDRSVPNTSEAPRVSIEAVYSDASPLIAWPAFKVTRSNTSTSALTVSIEFTQTDTYLSSTTQTITIAANQTTKSESFNMPYSGNTSGNLVATVAAGGGYAPALSPNNSATVQVKVPATGATFQVLHSMPQYTVDEDAGTFDAGVAFTTSAEAAVPRFNGVNTSHFQVAVLTRAGTATINVDYGHISLRLGFDVANREQTGDGGYKFTAIASIDIHEDDEYEPDEAFEVYFTDAPGVTLLLIPTNDVATVTIRDNDSPLRLSEVEVTSTPTGGYYGATDTIAFTATFNGKVTVTGTPQFAFELGGETRQADYASGSDSTDLVFSYTVLAADPDDPDGISWGANALSLNGGTIKFMHADAAEQVAARLSHPAQTALPGHKSDTQKPALDEAEVDESTLSMFFTEDLNTTAPANSVFTVKVDGGTGANPTAVSISGSTVTLTLASPVTSGRTTTVSYAKPSSNPIKDLTGKEADSFTDRTVDPASDIANFLATPGNRRVRLDWDNPNDSTIRRYQYRYMHTSDTDWNPDWRNISGSSANTTSYTATGLTNGVEYTFQVRPVTRVGGQDVLGREGEVKSIPRAPLRAPRSFNATHAGDGEIALSWDDPGDITITGYQYRYRNTSDTDWNPDWTAIAGSDATTTSHTLSGLTNNLLYTVELRAMRGATGGPASRDTQKPRGPLAAPANFRAASGENTRSTLSWDNSGDESITRFQYRYRITTESLWNPDWIDVPGSRWTTTSYTVRGLVNRTGYTFELRALRDTFEGPSSSDTATPEGPPSVPLPPQDLEVYPADRSLGLSWEPPVEEDPRAPVTGYRVRYREVGRSWRTVSRQSANLVRWQTISGLRNGRTYEVQVASVNRVGTGSYTTGITGTPEAPEVGESPPEPEGDEAFDVGALGVWWEGTDANGDNWGNLREMASCAGTYRFTVIWAGPGDDRNAAEWAAHIAPSGGASAVSYSFRRSPDTQDYYEMNGTARLDDPGYLSIRVRGRYGSTWGEWSPAAGLFCIENQNR